MAHCVKIDFHAGYARRLGMAPTDVGEPEEALRLAIEATKAGTPFQMVFADFQMPGMDGLALVRAMREESCLTAVPILLLTSVDHAGFTARAWESGVSQYLIKPVNPNELRDAALHALCGARSPMNAKRGTDPETEYTRPLRVLVAEDNPINQRLVVRLLEKLGHQAVVAANGRLALEALDKAKTEKTCFDVVLMDCQMPEMDGFEATGRIRQLARDTGSRIPIVALTAHALKGDRERYLESGMDDYLSKPINRKDLAVKMAGVAELRDRPFMTAADRREHWVSLIRLHEAVTSPDRVASLDREHV